MRTAELLLQSSSNDSLTSSTKLYKRFLASGLLKVVIVYITLIVHMVRHYRVVVKSFLSERLHKRE